MNEIIINIFNITGSSFCVESDDGQKVFNVIEKALKENKKIKLSFQNIEMVTTAFLNTAIGQLYRDFNEKKIKDSLDVKDLPAEDKQLLKRVISTAKLFYKDPNRMKKSIEDILGED
jgi:Icc-related predicted phosphoesterase